MGKYVKKENKLKPGPVPTGRVRKGVYVLPGAWRRLKALALSRGESINGALEYLLQAMSADMFGPQEQINQLSRHRNKTMNAPVEHQEYETDEYYAQFEGYIKSLHVPLSIKFKDYKKYRYYHTYATRIAWDAFKLGVKIGKDGGNSPISHHKQTNAIT